MPDTWNIEIQPDGDLAHLADPPEPGHTIGSIDGTPVILAGNEPPSPEVVESVLARIRDLKRDIAARLPGQHHG